MGDLNPKPFHCKQSEELIESQGFNFSMLYAKFYSLQAWMV